MNDVCVDSPHDITNNVVNYFSSVFSDDYLTFPFPHQTTLLHFQLSEILVEGVRCSLVSLKSSSTMIQDCIPSLILNRCSFSLFYPLYKILRKNFTFGKIPSSCLFILLQILVEKKI